MSKMHKPDRATILRVAAAVGCDPRLAAKILEHGAAAARNLVHRERAERVLAEIAKSTN